MQALESNRRNPGAGTIGLGKGGERIFQRHIPNHAVVRRNLGTASEARAEVEIGRDGDIGRHRGHIQRTKEARIATDIGEMFLARDDPAERSEKHTSELQSLLRISYAVICLNKKTKTYRQ